MKTTANLTVESVLAMQAKHIEVPSQEPINLAEHGQLIDALFERLTVLFPVGSPASAQVGAVKSEWLKVLAIHKVLNKHAVQAGLMRARMDAQRKYWPSPLQFANWCKGSAEDHNVPHADDAFREAVRHYRDRKSHSWSHMLVYAAVQQVGAWAFSQSSERELRAQFEHVYAQLVRRSIDGHPIDVELPKALPKPGQTTRLAPMDCPARLKALRLVGLGGQTNV